MKIKRFVKLIFAGVMILSVLLCSVACNNAKKGGKFIIELYPEYAPQTVDNFVKLVEEGFYDGLLFHRVFPGFMAQGGGYTDPDISNPTNKKQADSIFGEFAGNSYTENTLSHTHGVISMARLSNDFNSASSEFFICYENATSLDGDYAAFGKVIEGMEVVDALQEVEKKMGFSIDSEPTIPVNPIKIKKAVLLEDDGGNPKVEMEIEY